MLSPKQENHAERVQQNKDFEGSQITNSFAPPSFSVSASPVQMQAKNKTSNQQKPGDLEELFKCIGETCPAVDQAFMDTIHNATTKERQAILNNPKYIDIINNNIGGTKAAVIMSALMEGSQKWQNPPASDFYQFYIKNGGKGKMPTSKTMNCWESIMHAFYLAKQITLQDIKDFYAITLKSTDGALITKTLWANMGFNTKLPRYPKTTPQAGQLIYYLEKGKSIPGHVALSLGGDQVMSLWSKPNNVDSVQKIAINDLVGPQTEVLVGNPKW